MASDSQVPFGFKVGFAAVILVVLVVIALAVWPFATIDAGEVGVYTSLGAYEKSVGQGTHWRTPFVESVTRFSVQEQKEQTEATAASKDLQTVNATVAVNYKVDESKVAEIFVNIGTEYKSKIIDPAVQEVVKAATAKYTAEELITKRPLVTDDIQLALSERLSASGIIVKTVSIINFNFSDSFNAAIEAKVTAQQNALAAQNKLQQVQFEAEQTVATAKATAEAQRISSAALAAQGGSDYVMLKAIEKWNGVLPAQMIPGSSVPFLNVVK